MYTLIKKKFPIYCFTLLVAVKEVTAQVTLPPINLGGTSFLDGMGGPGTLVQQTFNQFSGNRFVDSQGHSLPGHNEITTQAATTLVARITEQKLFGGFYGYEAILPIANLDVNTEFGLNDQRSGLGDLAVSPLMIQWADKKLFGKSFSSRLNFVFNLPTGKYSEYSALNSGANQFAFNPYYAFTLHWTERTAMSMRLHYLWNGRNTEPYFMTAAKDTQAGQSFHLNYAISHHVATYWRVGFAGYYLEQLSEHEQDGQKIFGSKERIFAFGPGFLYSNQGFSIRANAYFESGALNRAEGNRYTVSYSQVF